MTEEEKKKAYKNEERRKQIRNLIIELSGFAVVALILIFKNIK